MVGAFAGRDSVFLSSVADTVYVMGRAVSREPRSGAASWRPSVGGRQQL